ncbi:Sec-independent protein translocase subunit TatA/TatB [Mucilaginibacter sp.]
MGGLGAPEIILIIIAILILFGGRKIPELMKGLGQGVKEFKNASNGESKEEPRTTSTTNTTTTNTHSNVNP